MCCSVLALAHRAAALRAFAAGVNAILHIADGFARIGARITNFGALSANMMMMRGLAQHEIGADLTDLRAIHHQLKVRRLDVFAARFEAMIGLHIKARRVAIETVLDALLHLRR